MLAGIIPAGCLPLDGRMRSGGDGRPAPRVGLMRRAAGCPSAIPDTSLCGPGPVFGGRPGRTTPYGASRPPGYAGWPGMRGAGRLERGASCGSASAPCLLNSQVYNIGAAFPRFALLAFRMALTGGSPPRTGLCSALPAFCVILQPTVGCQNGPDLSLPVMPWWVRAGYSTRHKYPESRAGLGGGLAQ